MIPNPKTLSTDDQFNLTVEFTDGQVRRVNIKEFVTSTGAKAHALKTDIKLFHKAFIEEGAISWPNNGSIDPEYVYLDGEKITSLPVSASFLKKVQSYRD